MVEQIFLHALVQSVSGSLVCTIARDRLATWRLPSKIDVLHRKGPVLTKMAYKIRLLIIYTYIVQLLIIKTQNRKYHWHAFSYTETLRPNIISGHMNIYYLPFI